MLVVIAVMADLGKAAWVFEVAAWIPYGDKLAHMILAGILSFLLNNTLRCRVTSILGIKALTGNVIAYVLVFAEEATQFWITTRNVEIWDVLTAIVGIHLFGRLAARNARMKKRARLSGPHVGRGACVLLLCLVCTMRAEQGEGELPLQLGLDLVDGSRVIGATSIKSITLQTTYSKINIPLKYILTVRMGEDHETAVVELRNGDKVTGVIDLERTELETLFGRVEVGIEYIREFSVWGVGGPLPAGKGPLAFGGLNWTPWRTMFEVQGDKLVTLPKARPGFDYGHGGNGRDATLVANIGNKDWKDYSIELEYGMSGVDPAFNPHGLPQSHRSGGIMFHVVDAKESWNEAGATWYRFGLNAKGGWSLGCVYNSHCSRQHGYGNPKKDGQRTLAKGEGLVLDPKHGNKIRIDVRGKRIQIWVDGKKIADVRDDEMSEPIGGRRLDHGGIGIHWSWECMGWIRKFSARRL
jgi:hypothetical protein